MDEGKAVDAVLLDFRKTLGAVPHSVLLYNLSSYRISRVTVHWGKNWLKGKSSVYLAGDQWCSSGFSSVQYINQQTGCKIPMNH